MYVDKYGVELVDGSVVELVFGNSKLAVRGLIKSVDGELCFFKNGNSNICALKGFRFLYNLIVIDLPLSYIEELAAKTKGHLFTRLHPRISPII